MKRTIQNVFSTLAASALLGISAGALAAGTDYDASRWSGDLRYSVYHVAAEYEATKAAAAMEAGQAGRAGPTSIPVARTGPDSDAWSGDLRYSVYHIAAEYAAAKAAGTLSSGQAGPSGPQSLINGRIEPSHGSDIRFSIYDPDDRAYW